MRKAVSNAAAVAVVIIVVAAAGDCQGSGISTIAKFMSVTVTEDAKSGNGARRRLR